jgi:DNA-directed RNA polymerase subunit RPC12/RpoP
MSTPERKVKEPTVTKAPPAGRKFPCPQCGAKLDFDPTTRALACPYCGHKVKIEHGSKDLKEHDLEAYLRDRDNLKTPVEGHANQVTCPACNAIVLLEDKVVTDRCPYCSTHLENVPRVAETMIQPEGVLPFKVDNRKAIEAFARWLGSLWFAPNALRKLANLGQLNGIYENASGDEDALDAGGGRGAALLRRRADLRLEGTARRISHQGDAA